MMRDSRQGANGAPSTLLRVDRFLVGRATLEGRLSYVNDAACAFFGRSADELIGQRYIDMVPAAEQATSRDRMRGVVQLARHVVAEMWLVNGNAERRCVQWVTFPEHSRDGEVVGYQVLGRDITELIAIRDALKRSERPPIADQLMFLVDAAGRFEGFHSEDSAPLFAPPKLFLGSMLEAALPPDLAIRSRVALGTTLAIGLPQTFDYTITEEQRTLPFRARAMRIDEQHALFVCFARHASEGNEGLLAALPDLVLRGHLGDDGSVDLVPAGGVAPLAEYLELARPVRAALDELVRRAVRSGNPQVLHEFQSTRDDRETSFEARVVRSGEHEAVCFVRNIDERRRQLMAMVEADRMRAISSLVSGVGHQINNPLSYVVGNLDFLRGELEDARDTLQDSLEAGVGDDGKETMGVAMAAQHALESFENVADALADIDEGVERIANIVRDLRVFDQEDQELTPLDVCEIIDEAAAIADNEIRHRAQLSRRYGTPAYVFGNARRLRQLFHNVLLNAAHAIDEGAATSNDITVAVTKNGEDWVDITISDSGRGIAPELMDQVFDPFFTTKPVGEGTGLGLAVCREIARLHGGQLSLESERHVGTDVKVRLCAASAPPEQPADRDDEAPPQRLDGDAPRILLIDDEPGVGRVVPRMLGDQAQVTFFATARAALEEIERGAQFDLVLCDLMMPEMTGMQFYERLVERQHDLVRRIVFVTGGAFTNAAQSFLDEVDAPVLYKPFDRADLQSLLVMNLGHHDQGDA